MDTIEQLLGLLKDQTEINKTLQDNQSDRLVDDNIAKSPSGSTFGEKTPSKLSTPEIRRVNEASNIFIKNFFDMEKKMKTDKKEKTLTSTFARRADTAMSRQGTQQSGAAAKGGGSWWEKLLAALGLGGLLKKLTPKFFKELFKKLLTKVGNLIKSIGNMISSLWKKITNSKFVRSIRRAIQSAMKGIGRFFSRIASSFRGFLSSLVKRLKGVWSSIRGSKAFKAVAGAFKSATKAIGSFFTGLKNKLLSLLNTVKEFAKNLIPQGAKDFIGKGVQGAKGAVSKTAGSWWEAAKNLGGKAWSATKAGASAVGKGIVNTGSKAGKVIVQGAKAVGNFALEPAKATVREAASGVIKGSGGMFKLMGKLAKLPVLGPIIEGAFTAYDLKALKEKWEKGEITIDEYQSQAGRRVIQGVGAVGGSALGTFLGASAGTIIPVAGNVVGGILGAIGGDLLGRFVAGLINDYIMPPQYSKSIGAFVTGTPAPKEEMQDFIIRGNQVYPFSNKDEVLGMKHGGAIDQFLGSKQENRGMGLLLNAASQANIYLNSIERNTRELIKVMTGKTSPSPMIINQASPSNGSSTERMTAPVENNRLGYSTSPYALA